jgi:catechol 2,3-dioxygenase-like lactoylglutathione lyase family enzyme
MLTKAMDKPALAFSHVGLFATDLARMEAFYAGFLGFTVTDRGVLPGPTGPMQLLFLSREPDEHHQVVLISGRPASVDFNVVNQVSLRVDGLDTLRSLHRALEAQPGTDCLLRSPRAYGAGDPDHGAAGGGRAGRATARQRAGNPGLSHAAAGSRPARAGAIAGSLAGAAIPRCDGRLGDDLLGDDFAVVGRAGPSRPAPAKPARPWSAGPTSVHGAAERDPAPERLRRGERGPAGSRRRRHRLARARAAWRSAPSRSCSSAGGPTCSTTASCVRCCGRPCSGSNSCCASRMPASCRRRRWCRRRSQAACPVPLMSAPDSRHDTAPHRSWDGGVAEHAGHPAQADRYFEGMPDSLTLECMAGAGDYGRGRGGVSQPSATAAPAAPPPAAASSAPRPRGRGSGDRPAIPRSAPAPFVPARRGSAR